MQNDSIAILVDKIKSLESELEQEIDAQFKEFSCEITKKKEELKAIYKQDKQTTFSYLFDSPLSYILTFPIVWICLIPAFFLDIFVSLFQAICFPIYKIAKVKRSDYIIVDRHKLGYLNIIQKANCWYCSYFNGLLGYVAEISGRTEQFWCPIRHASRTRNIHQYYKNLQNMGIARLIEKVNQNYEKS
ncbi:MAG: hypothetical protein ACXW1A_02865 [Nitrososphaeraceae archaeon]